MEGQGVSAPFMDAPGAAPADATPAYRALIERLYGLSRFGMKLGLDRMEGLLAALGHPERAFRAVHVAGSNGKGSTSAFLATILAAHGRRVGLYTSPHLVSLTERVQILTPRGRDEVRPERLVDAVARVEAVHPGLEGLTFFEVMTAAGLLALAAEGVEIAVIEAGLGAKLDATRVVPAEVAVLTDLSLEHTQILGDTIEQVAADEGCVVRPGRPLVAADGPDGAMRVLDALVDTAGATLYRLGEQIRVDRDAGARSTFELAGPDGPRALGPLSLALRGPHQDRNALLAAQAALLLEPDVTDATLARGLTEARWPGRMEVVERPGRPRVLLDGAQNPHAARALAHALAADPIFEGPRHFVFGALSDKDVAEMLDALAPGATSFALTRPASRRARDPARLAARLRARLPAEAVTVAPDIPAALAAAEARAALDGGWVVVCGSLYLVGDARAVLLRGP